MALNLQVIERVFKTPITVAGVQSHKKFFYEGTIDNIPFELSVLPGLHQETFEQAKAQLEELLPAIVQSQRAFDLGQDYFNIIERAPVAPSVMFAIESWLFRRAKISQQHPWNLPVTQNALLLSPDPKPLLELRQQGFNCYKIKIGRGESANVLSDLCRHLQPHERLRLDGNRLLTPAQLQQLLAPLQEFWPLIEYVEEPFAELSQLLSWQHSVELAFDESLPLLELANLPKNLSTVVLKPSLFGFKKSIQMIRVFNQYGVPVTLSSSFEGPTGLEAIFALSSLQNSLRPNPAGLDTLRYFN